MNRDDWWDKGDMYWQIQKKKKPGSGGKREIPSCRSPKSGVFFPSFFFSFPFSSKIIIGIVYNVSYYRMTWLLPPPLTKYILCQRRICKLIRISNREGLSETETPPHAHAHAHVCLKVGNLISSYLRQKTFLNFLSWLQVLV